MRVQTGQGKPLVRLFTAVVVVLVAALSAGWVQIESRQPTVRRTITDSAGQEPSKVVIRRVILSGVDFRQLWIEALSSLQDLKAHTTKPSITGNPMADKHIQTLAEARGYRLQAESTAQLARLDGELVHPAVLAAWQRLVGAARQDGVGLVNNSGYRSVTRQRQLFLSRFQAAGGSRYSSADIAAGRADSLLDRILSTSSIPGYSRHHTGYTVDIGDRTTGQTFHTFASSPGYAWMSKGNYANARRFGFIPSYPPGAGRQGPDPEPWEFVWIGDLQIPSY
jgi:LAS superfamily LD-carboxypeptidase LdcB